jgi:hypothetical protein
MRRAPRGTLSFAVAAILLLFAALMPGTLARFVDSPAVPANVFSARPTFGGVHVATGSHVGNGVDNRAFTGIGFTPDLVIVKSHANAVAVARTSTMAGDVSKALTGGAALNTNRIQSLDANGFTLGTNNAVNANGVVYSWVAFRTAPGMTVGTYTGDGAASRAITGLAFSPDYVMVLAANGNATVQRAAPVAATYRFDQAAASANSILSLNAAGFTVGNHGQVNQNGIAYHYVAWNAAPGQVSVGSYTGNAADDRSITGPGFLPEYALVRRSTNGNACDRASHRTADVSGDLTLNYAGAAAFANGIQALQATGFQVGTDCRVNTNASTYLFVAFNDY